MRFLKHKLFDSAPAPWPTDLRSLVGDVLVQIRDDPEDPEELDVCTVVYVSGYGVVPGQERVTADSTLGLLLGSGQERYIRCTQAELRKLLATPNGSLVLACGGVWRRLVKQGSVGEGA